MSYDIFSLRRIQYFLEKCKNVFFLKEDVIEITKANYDALTPQQRAGKHYYITDIDTFNNEISDNEISTSKAWSSQNIINKIYPVGSIFITTVNTNPSTYLGGTWVEFATGKTLVGIDTNDTDFDTVEETGGEKTHKLTLTEIPSHNHKATVYYNSATGGNGFWGSNATGTAYTIAGTQSAGGSGAHNNLQPYITVYMFKRTA